jgi:hypothetical protein
MRRGIKRALLGLVIFFAAAQLIRPARINPATDPGRTMQSPPELASILDRSCGDCHSNRTRWPWYTKVAPVSWLMAYAVNSGRTAVNFSEWAGYPPEQQRQLLTQSCRDVSKGTMPGSAWISLHREARLSTEEIAVICAAAGEKP